MIKYPPNSKHYKIAYYGTPHSGKITNLLALHQLYPDSHQDVLQSSTERTLYVGNIPVIHHQQQAYFHCYTTGGGVLYAISYLRLLNGIHGIVFVVDSSIREIHHTVRWLIDLRRYLHALSIDSATIPIVIQYNKRDRRDKLPIATLNQIFKNPAWKRFEAIAYKQEGVRQTFMEIAMGILQASETINPPA